MRIQRPYSHDGLRQRCAPEAQLSSRGKNGQRCLNLMVSDIWRPNLRSVCLGQFLAQQKQGLTGEKSNRFNWYTE
jgi:hypothetical protein